MPIILDQTLYDKVKKEADIKYKKPSAYKSGWIVKTYKERGGKYADDNQPKNLERWFKEKWDDIGGKEYPVYRPHKRISKETPLTADEIDPKQAEEQIKLKQIIRGTENLPPFEAKGEGLNNNYIKSVTKALHKYYGKNVSLQESSRKDKKFMVISPEGKKIHFGQKGYEDWHIHKDPKRRERFRTRNAKWANADKWTPAHLAYWVLW